MSENAPERVAERIISDLTGRRGFGQVWDQLDDGIRNEIKRTLTQIVRNDQKLTPFEDMLVRAVVSKREAKAAYDEAYDARAEDYEAWSKGEPALRTAICACDSRILKLVTSMADGKCKIEPCPTCGSKLRIDNGDACGHCGCDIEGE